MLISRDVMMKTSTDETILRPAAVFSNLTRDDDVELIRRLGSMPLSGLKKDFYRSTYLSFIF